MSGTRVSPFDMTTADTPRTTEDTTAPDTLPEGREGRRGSDGSDITDPTPMAKRDRRMYLHLPFPLPPLLIPQC